MDALSCGWDTARFLIFSENVFASFIYYSHLGPLIASAIIGIAVIANNSKALVNRALFVMMTAFVVWVYFDLILWASEKSEYIMFFWAAMAPVELLIYATGWYLVTVLANRGAEPSLREKLIAAATFIPIFLLAHTSYNLLGFDLTNCDREPIEGPLWQYVYIVELFYIIWAVTVGIIGYCRTSDRSESKQLVLVTSGIVLFLLAFSIGNILVFSILDTDWSYEQYKLIGMPILAAFVAYSAIRFKTFDLKLITSQALVISVSILVFSLLFIRKIENVRIVTILTFILVCVLGHILVRNIRREIEQRVLIEKQEKELEVINKQQENLLHFISHEVKGYLTDGEAGFASIAEGDYTNTPPKLVEMAKSGLVRIRSGVRTVMEILDSSSFKQGTIIYKKETFDLKEVVLRIVSRLKRNADEKHITVTVSVNDGIYTMEGDKEKLCQHVVRNLIDNAIQYTPTGTVIVELTHVDPSTKLGTDKLRLSVKDSGIGITPEDMQNLFTEGGHGKDSLKINVHSTGYGLFIAKQVVETHGGKIWAESEGNGKGSKFIAEFPIT